MAAALSALNMSEEKLDETRSKDGGDEKIRLSVKGALRETGRHSKFEFTEIDPKSQTGRLESQRLLIEQIENIDFYMEQGFLDVALGALERLEASYPNHPMIIERLERMAQLEKGGEVTPIPSLLQSETPQPQRETGENKVFFNPVEVAEQDVAPSVESSLFQAEKSPTGELDQTEIAEVDFRSTQSFENSLNRKRYKTLNEVRSLFDELQEEFVEEEVAETDFQEHFNVGLAYLDIDLVDDAIEEFQTAFKAIEHNSSSSYKCCLQLGRCFVLKSMHRPALIWFKRAAEALDRSNEEYAEAYYEQALVYEEMSEPEIALKLYQKVSLYVPDYKDISERMQRLRSTADEAS